MSIDAVNRIGEGRVYAGTRSRDLHLVDHIGGLLAAIDRAQMLAHLPDDCEVREVPGPPPSLIESLLSLASAGDPLRPVTQLLLRGEAGTALRWLYAVSLSDGRPMAMIDWPIEMP
jgi:ClpP class serine protease